MPRDVDIDILSHQPEDSTPETPFFFTHFGWVSTRLHLFLISIRYEGTGRLRAASSLVSCVTSLRWQGDCLMYLFWFHSATARVPGKAHL